MRQLHLPLALCGECYLLGLEAVPARLLEVKETHLFLTPEEPDLHLHIIGIDLQRLREFAEGVAIAAFIHEFASFKDQPCEGSLLLPRQEGCSLGRRHHGQLRQLAQAQLEFIRIADVDAGGALQVTELRVDQVRVHIEACGFDA